MFYIVEVRFRADTAGSRQFAVSTDSNLFQLVFMLDNYADVVRFQVTGSGTKLFPKDFGWGTFSKWDSTLYKEDDPEGL